MSLRSFWRFFFPPGPTMMNWIYFLLSIFSIQAVLNTLTIAALLKKTKIYTLRKELFIVTHQYSINPTMHWVRCTNTKSVCSMFSKTFNKEKLRQLQYASNLVLKHDKWSWLLVAYQQFSHVQLSKSGFLYVLIYEHWFDGFELLLAFQFYLLFDNFHKCYLQNSAVFRKLNSPIWTPSSVKWLR